ncbi:MAG: GAF domain-containing protein [Nocardioidaceae bacterium]
MPTRDEQQPGEIPGDVPRAEAAPRLSLDDLLEQLVARATDVMGAHHRLRGLLEANQAVIGNLDLDQVLHRIVQAAKELVGANYGALGVIAPHQTHLAAFEHVGIAPEIAEKIGHLPQGKGLLGELIAHPVPVRVDDLTQHPASVGFPPGHPEMRAFLGVPVRVRDEVFGNLYLTRSTSTPFTEEDEELVLALAATAGIAVENARLYDEAQRRQEWLRTSTEVTRLLLAGSDDNALRIIAEEVLDLSAGQLVCVLLPSGEDELVVDTATGAGSEQFVGAHFPRHNTLAELAMDTGRPLRADARDPAQSGGRSSLITERGNVGPIMVLPLAGASVVRGALIVARSGDGPPFSHAELDIAGTFANQASLALELADARRDQQRMLLLEDRTRIARDLHDHVIQQLFAAGMTMQGLQLMPADQQKQLMEQVVDHIDDAVRQIRVSIYQLQADTGAGLRSAVLGIIDELRPALGFEPKVRFDGPVDTLAVDGLLADVEAVVRECLTNVLRHSGATRVQVDVAAAGQTLTIKIADDGAGLGAPTRRSGLRNLGQRAEARGGRLETGPGLDGRGVALTWTASAVLPHQTEDPP